LNDFDLAQMRNRIRDLEDALERFRPSSIDNGSVALLVQTTTKTIYPAVAGDMYYCSILNMTGDTDEGSLVGFPGTGKHLLAANVGGRVPPVGTKLIAVYTGGRWAIRYD